MLEQRRFAPLLYLTTEFFPPNAPAPMKKLRQTWTALRQAGVSSYSLTFGALGSAQDKSTSCLKYMRAADKKTSPVMHLTCRGQSWHSLECRLEQWRQLGVERVLALRGDAFSPRTDGPNSSVELIQFLDKHGFKSSVAAYPDGHPDAKAHGNSDAETDWLKRKLDAGADQVVTQFAPGIRGILRLRDTLERFEGLSTHLKVGVMPIPDWQRYVSLVERCGISGDPGEGKLFETLAKDSHAALSLGLAYANMRALIAEGLTAFHLYGLNNARLLLPLIESLQALDHPAAAPCPLSQHTT